MQVLAIDIGSYSIKFSHMHFTKGVATYTHFYEEKLSIEEKRPEADSVEQETYISAQLQIIQDYISKNVGETEHVIMSIPHYLTTTRFLQIPIKNKKKAVQMLPFQLEENIPFSLSQCVYQYSIQSQKMAQNFLVSFVSKNVFDPIWSKMKQFNPGVSTLTTEVSCYQNYIHTLAKVQGREKDFCILDIGHQTSKAYFFINDTLISSHISYVSGSAINEEISQNYKITKDEAIIFKHQNSFFLTEEQYQIADEKQKSFAKIMDQLFLPLINDFKRWELGLKVHQGAKIKNIFLTGGTSNIKNIESFISRQVNLPVSKLNVFETANLSSVDSDKNKLSKFNLTHLISLNQKNKSKVINFLRGDYNLIEGKDLPLHSTLFNLSRVAVIFLLVMVTLLVERSSISNKITKVNSRITTLIKDPSLNINGRQRRSLRKNPKAIYSKLSKKKKEITSITKSLQTAVNINYFKPLEFIKSLNLDAETTVSKLETTNDKSFVASISSESADKLKKLEEVINNYGLKKVKTTFLEAKKELSINATLE